MSALSSVSNSANADYAAQLEQTSNGTDLATQAVAQNKVSTEQSLPTSPSSVDSNSSANSATFIGGGSLISSAPIDPEAAIFGHLLTYLPNGNTSPPSSRNSATDGLDTTA
jgi:hypothetical protein